MKRQYYSKFNVRNTTKQYFRTYTDFFFKSNFEIFTISKQNYHEN